MTPVTAVAGASGGTTTTITKNDAGSEDRFLKLLVAQMQNQDPMNPLDNAQVTSQMAQINTVTGNDKLNTTVAGLNGQLVQLQALQGATLVGRAVTVAGDRLAVVDGQGVGGFELQEFLRSDWPLSWSVPGEIDAAIGGKAAANGGREAGVFIVDGGFDRLVDNAAQFGSHRTTVLGSPHTHRFLLDFGDAADGEARHWFLLLFGHASDIYFDCIDCNDLNRSLAGKHHLQKVYMWHAEKLAPNGLCLGCEDRIKL